MNNAQQITKDLLNQFYEEFDDTVLNIMAYGISPSELIVTKPKLIMNDAIAHIECHIGTVLS